MGREEEKRGGEKETLIRGERGYIFDLKLLIHKVVFCVLLQVIYVIT